MVLTIYESLLNALARAIETQRPEILGVHTKGYQKSIPPPWNANDPLDPVNLPSSNATLDYDGRGSQVTFTLRKDNLDLVFLLNALVSRTSGAMVEDDHFSESAKLEAHFGDASKGNYPLLISETLFVDLNPSGIRNLLSWIISDAITGSLQGLGVPLYIPFANGKLKLSKPALLPGKMVLNAALET